MSYSKTTYLALVIDISNLITNKWDENLRPYYEGQKSVHPFQIFESGFDGNGKTYFGIVLETDSQQDMIDSQILLDDESYEANQINNKVIELFGGTNYSVELRMFSCVN